MKEKQMKIFSENDFEPKKTYFLKKSNWFFIDDVKRTTSEDFVRSSSNREQYNMVANLFTKDIYASNRTETNVLIGDYYATSITIWDYFALANLLKHNGKYIYNKKLGKCIPKKGFFL
jgi:hypothetical protein